MILFLFNYFFNSLQFFAKNYIFDENISGGIAKRCFRTISLTTFSVLSRCLDSIFIATRLCPSCYPPWLLLLRLKNVLMITLANKQEKKKKYYKEEVRREEFYHHDNNGNDAANSINCKVSQERWNSPIFFIPYHIKYTQYGSRNHQSKM